MSSTHRRLVKTRISEKPGLAPGFFAWGVSRRASAAVKVLLTIPADPVRPGQARDWGPAMGALGPATVTARPAHPHEIRLEFRPEIVDGPPPCRPDRAALRASVLARPRCPGAGTALPADPREPGCPARWSRRGRTGRSDRLARIRVGAQRPARPNRDRLGLHRMPRAAFRLACVHALVRDGSPGLRHGSARSAPLCTASR